MNLSRLARSRRLRLVLVPLGIYLTVCIIMYLAQAQMLFPTALVGSAGPLPPGAERLSLDTPGGIRLEGVHLPPARGEGDGTLILSFAGNATNGQDLAERLRVTFPEHPIAAFHYRGYAPSGGSAEAAGIVEDAPLAYDLVVGRYRPRKVVAVGVSLGSGVAATLADRRPLSGVILVTPFDSLKNVARQIYWWLPVGLLMRHDVDSAAALAGSDTPVAIIAAERDRLVRPERTDALRRSVRQLRHDATIPDATHNDIFSHPRFDQKMREALRKIAG
jgi:pimeloyl-ACP methyl ester carboxylesterase